MKYRDEKNLLRRTLSISIFLYLRKRGGPCGSKASPILNGFKCIIAGAVYLIDLAPGLRQLLCSFSILEALALKDNIKNKIVFLKSVALIENRFTFECCPVAAIFIDDYRFRQKANYLLVTSIMC
jgi:hypothetical protein